MPHFQDALLILDTIPMACYMLDNESNFIYVNNKAGQFFGKEKTAMLGKNIWSLFPEVKETNYFHELNQAIAQKKSGTFEYISIFSKGWIKLNVNPVSGGVVVSFECIEKDKRNENLYQTLVENTPDVVTKWNSDLRLSYGNTTFTHKTKLTLHEAWGKTPQQIWPHTDVAPLIEKINSVLENGHIQRVSMPFKTPLGELFYDIKLAPEFTIHNQAKSVIAIGRDITSLKKSQEIFNTKLRQKYTSLFNSINQGFCIIEIIWDKKGHSVDYRFTEVNPAFQKQTGIQDYEGKTIREIWPQHEEHWFKIFGEIVRSKKSAHFELPATLINGWFEIEAFPITELGDNLVGILFNDITERKKAENILRQSDEKQSYLLKLTDAIRFISNPLIIQELAARVIAEQLDADYAFYAHVTDINHVDYIQIERLYQKRKQIVFKPGLYPLSDLGEEREYLKAGKTRAVSPLKNKVKNQSKEFSLYETLQSHAWIAVPLIKRGQLAALLMVYHSLSHIWSDDQVTLIEETAERTWSYVEQANMAKELNHSQEQLAVALTASNMSTFHWLSKKGRVMMSPLSPVVFGLKNKGLSYNENEGFSMIHPDDKEKHNQILEKACEEQKEFHHVYRIIRPIDGKIAWIEERGKGVYHPHSRISEVRGIHWDITAQKKQEELIRETEEKYLAKLEKDVQLRTKELKESRDELAAIYNNTLMGMSVLKTERDKKGNIIDFRIALTNKALEKETGRNDLIGKLYAEEYPGIKKVGLFEKMVKVMETGVPISTEYFYPFEDFNKWYSCMFVKMGDNLLATNLDISERKIAEQLFNENSAMIQGIANSAPDMLYAINLETMQQFYSNYRIEHLVEKSQIEIKKMGKGFFEKFIHPDDKVNFYACLDEFKGKHHKEIKSLTYRLIDAKGKIHWITTKSTVYMRDESGNSTHIVGISQDITQQRALEEKNKQLTYERRLLEKQQQKQILKATLNAQEEERQRIAESLHNGLGQVLYGVKTTLDRIKLTDSENSQALNRSKELLGMCIQESRKISHELMPSILEDFGLKAAIHDICLQLKGETYFNCTFSGMDIKLDKYLQLAIYRIVQELALNIMKHAEATIAHINISVVNNHVHIMAKDNGKGFEQGEEKNKGIGLKTIESKVKLLNGKITINSVPHQTVIHIQFPI
ncbi:PAS domain S-box protein [Pedobacter sp.]|uniref:PAS domain S-box protein n=1 Tax=Pedobacter sp. TaxID=1411316 RepID=UPI00396C890F